MQLKTCNKCGKDTLATTIITMKNNEEVCINCYQLIRQTIDDLSKRNNTENKLSDIPIEALKHKCPNCETGDLHEVTGETEQYLWCNTCDLSMDSDGGFIA